MLRELGASVNFLKGGFVKYSKNILGNNSKSFNYDKQQTYFKKV